MLAIVMFAAGTAEAAHRFVDIPSIFSDNMVLQQKSEVPFWGKAAPNVEVTVRASWGEKVSTTVSSDSSWMIDLKTVVAGGPYKVTLTVGDSTTTFTNVMLGEVWLCSGQSNMQFPLEGWPPEYPMNNAAKEVREAGYSEIRLFRVARTASASPRFNCAGAWRECTPKSAATFSAVAYFFGRKLYRQLHVPIGLICASWGGTKIQPWISAKYLSRVRYYRKRVRKIVRLRSTFAGLNRWVSSHRTINAENKSVARDWAHLNFDDSMCLLKDYDDSGWKSMTLPGHWSSSIGAFYGAVWFRKRVEIPKTWIDSTLVLSLGAIADMDQTWVNGREVGEHFGGGLWGTPRVYIIPKRTLKSSGLTIAIRVIANGGGGGILGGGMKMIIHPKGDRNHVSISGEWKYMPVAEYSGRKFYVFGPRGEFYHRPHVPFQIQQNTPSALFNGMISSLIPFRIRGVIWYQGESNSGSRPDYDNYARLFPLLINNWRHDWHEGRFPFYWVQIAPFDYGSNSKSYVIRDAQRRTLALPNTGMAVTLDIGSRSSIHPPDKKDVGNRLALWALAKDYGRHIVYSGPLFRSMTSKGREAILKFRHTDGGLVLRPVNGNTNFEIAGKDSIFVKADAEVKGKSLVVYSPAVNHPVAVRYAWSNSDRATLFNRAGLPASTFRTDNWPQ